MKGCYWLDRDGSIGGYHGWSGFRLLHHFQRIIDLDFQFSTCMLLSENCLHQTPEPKSYPQKEWVFLWIMCQEARAIRSVERWS
jgi:hypothetical protein